MKTKVMLFTVCALTWMMTAPSLFAQCPAGQTSVTLEINAPSFGTEISWELVNTTTGMVVASQPCGTYATGDVVLEGPFCLNDGDTYDIIGYDTFGDDWNGGFVNVIISEDGSVNGCLAQTGCIALANAGEDLDVEPDVPSTNTCAAGTNIEFTVSLPIFACDATDVVGCTDPAGLNYNDCATTDDGSCLIPAEGDDCNVPVQICGTTPVSATNLAATTIAGDPIPTCIGTLESTVWFVFDSDASGTPIDIMVTEGACSVGSGLQVALYSGIDCAGGGVEEACTTAGPAYTVSLAAPAPNTTYYVYVDGVAGAECAFNVEGSGGIAECCGPEFDLTPSCQAGDEDNFYVEIDVTDLGTDTEYTITGGANITATGTQVLGPFPNGSATITLSAVNTDCVIENPIDFDCSCDPLAITAGEDIGPACPDVGPFELTSVREEVIPGGFLGTYTVTEGAPGSCTATPDDTPTVLALGDDAGSGPIALPFTFDFYGIPYTSLCVGSNGYVTFTCVDETDLSEDAIPDPLDPNAIIALFWDDLDPGGGVDGTISYFNATVGGQSCFVIEYNGVPHFPGPPSETITGQIIICPDGSIIINCIDCQADGGIDPAGQGIENEDGTAGEFDPTNFPGGISTGAASVMNCVTFMPDIQEPGPCDFVGWVTDLNDIAGSTVSTDDTTSVSPTQTTTYYAVVDCEGILCVDDVVVTLDPALCVGIGISDPCICENGIDLDGDGINDILTETITITPGVAPYTITGYSDGGTTGLVDMAGNPFTDTAIYPDAAAALTSSIMTNPDGSVTITVYIPADGVSVFSIEVTDSSGSVASFTKPTACPACATPPVEIPTVGEWGLIILALMMSIVAVSGIRQRRREEVIA